MTAGPRLRDCLNRRTIALRSGHDKLLNVELLLAEAELNPPRAAPRGRDGLTAVSPISRPVVGSDVESDLLLEDPVPQPSMLDGRARPRPDTGIEEEPSRSGTVADRLTPPFGQRGTISGTGIQLAADLGSSDHRRCCDGGGGGESGRPSLGCGDVS